MQTDVLFGRLEQLGQFELGEPDRAILCPQRKLGLAVFRGVEDQFAAVGGGVAHCFPPRFRAGTFA